MRSQHAYPHRPALTSHSADDTSISQPGQGGRFECRPGVTLPADSHRQEGRSEGLLEGQVGTIESLLRAGVQWSVIEAATGIDQDALRALRQRLEESEKRTEEAD